MFWFSQAVIQETFEVHGVNIQKKFHTIPQCLNGTVIG